MHLSLKDKILPQPPSFNKKKTYEIHGVLGEGSFGKVMVCSLAPGAHYEDN
jgi:calcium/calmodulin-dependent protein kinase I